MAQRPLILSVAVTLILLILMGLTGCSEQPKAELPAAEEPKNLQDVQMTLGKGTPADAQSNIPGLLDQIHTETSQPAK